MDVLSSLTNRGLKPLFTVFIAVLSVVTALAQSSLRIDFNDRSNDFPANTDTNFESFNINAVVSSTAIQTNTVTLRYGTLTVSMFDNLGVGYDDRKRSNPTNSATFTQAELLQDNIFARGTTTTGGLDIRISGLAATNLCHVTIWSFDSFSPGRRVSDWYANGILVKSNYTFDGNVLPTSNSDDNFSFDALADAAGEMLIQGRRNNASTNSTGAADLGVFINALQISPIPDQRPPCNTLTHFAPGVNLDGWTGGATTQEQDQGIAAMKEAGVQYVRINTPWHAIEPTEKGGYDTSLLSLYDHLVQVLHDNGIKIIFVNATTPYWASGDPAKTNGVWSAQYKPANFSDYSDFLVFLLNRYRSTGPHTFEVWNEEDVSFFWPSGPSATNYLSMLQNAYTAIKAADPQAIVLNGGFSDSSGTSNFVAALYAAGGKNYFDFLSQHVYARAPQYEKVVEVIRSVMTNNADTSKKIWITETGWATYTNAADRGAVSFDRQARYLTNLFSRLAAYPYVGMGLWYNLRSFDETQKEGSFGLLLTDFSRKPSFYAFKEWTAAAARLCSPESIRLSGANVLPNGALRIGFTATTGLTYSIQASSSLTNWQTIATNLSSTNGTNFFDDLSATNQPRHFYRMVWP